jgi:hypothetical protein
MAPETWKAPEDEHTVALSSGVSYYGQSAGALTGCELRDAFHPPGVCTSGAGE